MALPPVVRIASLCSGGGGLDLGVARALARLGRAHRGVVYVEREAYAAAVLASRIAEGALAAAPVWSDLATFDGDQLRGAVDLFIAGVPCQGNSVAGKRLGRADDRWLWPHVERILGAARPDWFFLENVRGLLSVDGGAAFADILGSLARLGFDVEWCVFRASDVGAEHYRARVFLLAYAHCTRLEGLHEARRGEHLQSASSNVPRFDRKATPRLHRSTDGLADLMVDRLRLLGNGVVPEQAAAAFIHLYERIING